MDSKRLIINQKVFQKNEKTEFILTTQIFQNKSSFFSFDWVKFYGKFLNFYNIKIKINLTAY